MVTAGLARDAVAIEPQGSTSADARYIATIHPEAGKAVAAWLRDAARSAARHLDFVHEKNTFIVENTYKYPLALADLVLARNR